MIIFVYLIADIPHNLTLLTSTSQGGTHNSRHTGQRYIHKGKAVNGKTQTAFSG